MRHSEMQVMHDRLAQRAFLLALHRNGRPRFGLSCVDVVQYVSRLIAARHMDDSHLVCISIEFPGSNELLRLQKFESLSKLTPELRGGPPRNQQAFGWFLQTWRMDAHARHRIPTAHRHKGLWLRAFKSANFRYVSPASKTRSNSAEMEHWNSFFLPDFPFSILKSHSRGPGIDGARSAPRRVELDFKHGNTSKLFFEHLSRSRTVGSGRSP